MIYFETVCNASIMNIMRGFSQVEKNSKNRMYRFLDIVSSFKIDIMLTLNKIEGKRIELEYCRDFSKIQGMYYLI